MTVYVTWFFLLLSTTVNPYMISQLRSFPRTSYYSKRCLGISSAVRKEEKIEPFNVVLTHCTADFDSLASACGLAKLWSTPRGQGSLKDYDDEDNTSSDNHYSTPREFIPTYVVLPRGAHPGVSKFLSLHKHLFPIRALRNLPDLGLERLGLVDAQRLERIGPASPLVSKAKHITVVDHHVDGETDIENVKVSRYEE
jgi:hypothetical protein